MTSRPFTLLGTALTVAAVAVPASAAQAASEPVSKSTHNVRVAKSVKKALTREGVKTYAYKGRKTALGTIVLKGSGGSVDFATARGVVKVRGGVRFKHAGRVATVYNMRVYLRGTKSKATGTIRGKRMTVFTIRPGSTKKSADRVTLKNARVKLTKQAAARLNSRLGVRTFRAGRTFATHSIVVQRKASDTGNPTNPTNPTNPNPDTPTAPPTAPDTGEVTLTPGFAGILGDAGLVPGLVGADGVVTPLVPGADGGFAAVLPVASSTVDPQAGTGSVSFSEGLSIALPAVGGLPATSVVLDKPTLEVGTNPGLYATVGGVRVKVFDIDAVQLAGLLANQKPGEGLLLDGLRLTLAGEVAPLLNALVAADPFTPGTPIGVIDVNVPAR